MQQSCFLEGKKIGVVVTYLVKKFLMMRKRGQQLKMDI